LSNLAPRKAARSSASACFFDGVEERERDLLLPLLSPKSSDTDFFGDAVGDREALFSLLFSLFHTFAGPTCLHMMTVL